MVKRIVIALVIGLLIGGAVGSWQARRRMENMTSSREQGIVNLPSRSSVAETAQRLVGIIESRGMTVFARIDQRAAANAVGIDMKPMVLLIFGNPKAGTPLMQKYPSLAIDLPLRALVWEDETGRIWISYNSPEYLMQRHGLAEKPFQAVEAIIAQAVQ
jgi:uncharacterized protein (DUF302 family)